jgi:hypothetical protein
MRPADGCRGSYYPMGWRTGAADPAMQKGRHMVPWILPSNGSTPRDRCRGSYYPMGWRWQISAVDPTTQGAGAAQAHRCRGSYYPRVPRRGIGAVDPTSQWPGGYVLWILVPNGPADRCCASTRIRNPQRRIRIHDTEKKLFSVLPISSSLLTLFCLLSVFFY